MQGFANGVPSYVMKDDIKRSLLVTKTRNSTYLICSELLLLSSHKSNVGEGSSSRISGVGEV